MTKTIVLWVVLLAGCGSVQRPGAMKGFCFEAREVGEKCYPELEACRKRERALRENHPWLVVTSSCAIAFTPSR